MTKNGNKYLFKRLSLAEHPVPRLPRCSPRHHTLDRRFAPREEADNKRRFCRSIRLNHKSIQGRCVAFTGGAAGWVGSLGPLTKFLVSFFEFFQPYLLFFYIFVCYLYITNLLINSSPVWIYSHFFLFISVSWYFFFFCQHFFLRCFFSAQFFLVPFKREKKKFESQKNILIFLHSQNNWTKYFRGYFIDNSLNFWLFGWCCWTIMLQLCVHRFSW